MSGKVIPGDSIPENPILGNENSHLLPNAPIVVKRLLTNGANFGEGKVSNVDKILVK